MSVDNRTLMALKLAVIALDKLWEKHPNMFLTNDITNETVYVGEAAQLLENMVNNQFK